MTLTIYIKEFVETCLLFALYYLSRARNWPPFFSLDLGDDSEEYIDGINPFLRGLGQYER